MAVLQEFGYMKVLKLTLNAVQLKVYEKEGLILFSTFIHYIPLYIRQVNKIKA